MDSSKSSLFFIAISALFGLIGCSTGTVTVGANAVSQSILAPRIETVNKKATVMVKEKVTGRGCRTTTLGFLKSGDGHMLSHNINSISTDVDYAKAAAEYDALFGKLNNHPPIYHEVDRPFPNDMLIAPLYHYEVKHSTLTKETCVTVTAFRGVIKSLDDSDTTTAMPEPKYKIIKKIAESSEVKPQSTGPSSEAGRENLIKNNSETPKKSSVLRKISE